MDLWRNVFVGSSCDDIHKDSRRLFHEMFLPIEVCEKAGFIMYNH